MQFLPDLPYPDAEKPKSAALGKLFRAWHKHFKSNGASLEKHVPDDMVFDGFYPHYFSQKKRVLFIGRESRNLSGCNYLDTQNDIYRTTQLVYDRPLDNDPFHSRMLHIAFGIVNDLPEWDKIPWASEIGRTFGSMNGLSFAFMNISKLSNEHEHFATDEEAVDASYDLSTQGRNFIQEEVAILEPDIIITMNLQGRLDALGERTLIQKTEPANSYWLGKGPHRPLLIDTWHFSAWTKQDVRDFYEPICQAIRRDLVK